VRSAGAAGPDAAGARSVAGTRSVRGPAAGPDAGPVSSPGAVARAAWFPRWREPARAPAVVTRASSPVGARVVLWSPGGPRRRAAARAGQGSAAAVVASAPWGRPSRRWAPLDGVAADMAAAAGWPAGGRRSARGRRAVGRGPGGGRRPRRPPRVRPPGPLESWQPCLGPPAPPPGGPCGPRDTSPCPIVLPIRQPRAATPAKVPHSLGGTAPSPWQAVSPPTARRRRLR